MTGKAAYRIPAGPIPLGAAGTPAVQRGVGCDGARVLERGMPHG